MMNPWIILGAVLFYAASMAGAYFKGGQHERNAAKAEYSRQLESSIAEANANAQIDMQAAREVGEREGRARARTVVIQGEAQVVFRDNPQPRVCDWTQPAFSVLQRAIESANDLAATPKPVPDAGARLKPPGKP